ncbi:NADH:flavin oxidoreductase/NADH oxidase family protein [Venturia nashicola]|uniref:NADH:flavin oxidoreductase/NADH oxidase family protein n=1 Tax=Venturia nashicola TaxID=86259 RepID=A0A4Z1P5E3_9PEZI|nr:NADH:flavin oxidoreductase/NADH oxidase family protein [Venturia nashicola]TLD30096.1 NADH:flavin oxidoreductase/NADH oxidase family protein [Venturia nashicola]
MAPLTRSRADEHNVPTLPIVKEYYEQRASVPGTLIITEATFISPQAGGYDRVPGIWNPEQIKAWKEVADAVHAKGSFIFMQLWALGRVAEPDVLKKKGFKVVSSSPLPIAEGKDPSHALTEGEIQEYIYHYTVAAKNAIEAGFDGVELHGANGYLPDQFLQDVINSRTDQWGGNIENRARFHLEITKALIGAVGKEKVGVRLSPFTQFAPGNKRMDDPRPTFTYLIHALKHLDIAFLDLIEPRLGDTGPVDGIYAGQGGLDFAIEAWGTDKPVLVAGGITAKKAEEMVERKYKEFQVIPTFGRFFISTPDLPFRVQKGIEFNPYDRPTFYTEGPKGYIDYPFSEEWKAMTKF